MVLWNVDEDFLAWVGRGSAEMMADDGVYGWWVRFVVSRWWLEGLWGGGTMKGVSEYG